jgi:hypothetical protein
MSIFKLQIVACNPGNEVLATPPLEALVDTSSELTWLPGDHLRQIGVVPQGRRIVSTAAKIEVERAVGYVVLRSNDRTTEDEVVFAEYGDSLILGLRTLKGFGLSPDDTEHRFIPIVKFVAFQLRESPGPVRGAAFCEIKIAQPTKVSPPARTRSNVRDGAVRRPLVARTSPPSLSASARTRRSRAETDKSAASRVSKPAN